MSIQSTATGSCFCGEVEFTVAPPTLFCAHCHCSMCRRSHGAGFVTWFGVPYEQFSIYSGEQSLVHFQSSEHGTRTFCGTCGSTLFCESTNHPERIDIVLANMNNAIDRKPEFHVYFEHRAEWTEVEDELPRLGGKTGVEAL